MPLRKHLNNMSKLKFRVSMVRAYLVKKSKIFPSALTVTQIRTRNQT